MSIFSRSSNLYTGYIVVGDNISTPVARIIANNNSAISGIMTYNVSVFDGIDLQQEYGIFSYRLFNKNGNFSQNNLHDLLPGQNAHTVGNISVTWALSSANPAILSITVNPSITPITGYPLVYFNIENLSNSDIGIFS